jgi:membrane fusion protein (multidrug efflux system)
VVDEPKSSLFREEAVAYSVAEGQRPGDVLRLAPGWVQRTYWVLLAVFVLGLLYLVLATAPEYAEGPAVIWTEPVEVTARSSGTVAFVSVRRGQQVDSGFPLLGFYDDRNTGELNHVRAPLGGRRGDGRIRTGQRYTVGDIRVLPGQRFTLGDELLTLMPQRSADEDGGLSIVAMLPARYLPLLDDRESLRFEPDGYPDVHQPVRTVSIGKQAVGPSTVRRYLGRDVGDVVAVQGPLVLVRAALPGWTFRSAGCEHEYHHGMQGRVALRVRSEPIIYTLLPWLKDTLVPWVHGILGGAHG